MDDSAQPDEAGPKLPDEALEFVAHRFRLLGDPQRLRILRELMGGECSVGELVDAGTTSQANVSKHLALLRAEGLVEARREGNRKVYSICDPSLIRLCHMVCDSLEARFAGRLERMRGT
jgi:DNA-binding transcriptional ArsR family regulator